jgi:hypothetical protein
MVSNGNLYLILGSFGRVDDGFVSCSSCENVILEINSNLDSYNDIMGYLDSCRLFDKPLFDFNSIRSVIQNLNTRFDQISIGRRLWLEKELQLFQKFVLVHKDCGLFLKLSIEKKDVQVKDIIINSQKTDDKVNYSSNNIKIRGRR